MPERRGRAQCDSAPRGGGTEPSAISIDLSTPDSPCEPSRLPRGGGTAGALEAAMSKLLRGVAAGWGAKKLGGGCLSTIVVFVILWYLLGHVGIFR
jgi:hypothetical protein